MSRTVVASVPWSEGCEGVGVGRASVQEVVGPFGDVGIGRVLAELGGCGLDIEVRGAEFDTLAQQGTVRSGPSVGRPMPPGLITSRPWARRANGMWVWPQTTVSPRGSEGTASARGAKDR
ncbi:hypothetical protein GCM10012286_64750 [Streptomyces lasiicapitis]|uniref:Uncharacterized protein n=1 Tax=Streptomyces lasiicapitis TaxID=1923961 RepID=A0ABQ2MLQ8_9ACTN|nr:hypothetical protein GCM10012286_64750 [Streptomyces lasiicapitis]